MLLDYEKCPICSLPLEISTSTLDWGTICEQYETCPNGCYIYEFTYGEIRIHVGEQEFGWNHNTDNDTRIAQMKAVDEAIANAHQAQRPQESR